MEKCLEKLYGQIEYLEIQIDDMEMRIHNVRQNKISGDKVYNYLLCFDKIYEQATDLKKKEFMNSLIKRVDIYEDQREDGKFLKSITFKFPIVYNNGEVMTLGLDEFVNTETIALIQKVKS